MRAVFRLLFFLSYPHDESLSKSPFFPSFGDTVRFTFAGLTDFLINTRKKMNNPVSFFEIPSRDFPRAVDFYQRVFGVELSVVECDTEKMVFFSDGPDKAPWGAVSYGEGFRPLSDGVLIHLKVRDIDATLKSIEKNGGAVIRPKTKIECEGMGSFALFRDSEGNRLGLHSQE